METLKNVIQSAVNQTAAPVFNPETRPQTQQPADGNTSTFIRNFGKFERPGATYMWKIFRPGREKLIGYSKPVGASEKANKQELLMDCIRRLAKNNYITEGMRVEIYRNFSDSDDDSVKLMSLFGTRFMPEPVIITEAWLMQFLKNFYNPVVYSYGSEMFPTGGRQDAPAGTQLIPDPTTQSSNRDPFDLTRHFKNEDKLHDYIVKLQREGHAKGLIEDYYRKQIQRFHHRVS